MNIRLLQGAVVVFLSAGMIAAPPKLRLYMEGDLAKIALPPLVGFRIVADNEAADFSLHARREVGVDGKPAVAVWLEPSITEDNRVIVSCDENNACKTRGVNDDTISALFFQALDIALFQDERGLGFMTISDCEAEEDRTQLDVVSSKNLGLDRYFHYLFAAYDKSGKRINVSRSTQYELRLMPQGRQSDTRGWFQGWGKTGSDTNEYLRKKCEAKKRDPKTTFKPLLIQLRPPELRWEIQAQNVRTN